MRRVKTYATYRNTTAVAAATTTPAPIPILALVANPDVEEDDDTVGVEVGRDVKIRLWEAVDVDVAVMKVDGVGVIVGVLIVETLDRVEENVVVVEEEEEEEVVMDMTISGQVVVPVKLKKLESNSVVGLFGSRIAK